ncbi:DUF2809 domain-containing protein [Sphingomonas sp. ST-64]|uniref:DUF2809 domain-containing protein n=1 Tax=Sphingomonas plantiphila TaxID=3163295 RepID=A0ABW8YKT4_9SPHN
MIRFHRGYALTALALFAIEVVIALFVRDRFVRPYLGDTLAVLLVYCGLRAITRLRAAPAAVTAFGVAVMVELGQLIGILDLLGWRDSPLARTILGTGFEWKDFLAYGAGAVIAIATEAIAKRR